MPFERENTLSPGRRDIGLAEVLKIAKRATAMGIRVQVPATVTSFNPATHRCQINVGFLPVRYTNSGEAVQQTPINLTNIPVEYPGAGDNYVQYPILPGTTGMMTVCDRSMERWNKNGLPADPALRKIHSLIDGVFRPGARPKTGANTVDMTAFVIESNLLIKLGAAASSPLVRGAELTVALLAFCDLLLGTFSGTPSLDPATLAAAAALKTVITTLSPGVAGSILSAKGLTE